MPTPARSVISQSGLRMLHSYVSAFIAPTIVFFALSGSLQTLNLHEAHGAYKPSTLISAMARLHKNQVFAPESKRPPMQRAGAQREQGAPAEPAATLSTQLLKGLFVLEALALIATTLLGAWIGVTHPKRARTFRIILGAGILVPVILIAI